jgi:hypothetical protein
MSFQSILSTVLVGGTLLLQGQPSSTPRTQQRSPASSENPVSKPAAPDSAVAPGDAVITIDDVCSAISSVPESASPCISVVTREQFERLASALEAEGQVIPANARQNLAEVYANLLTFEHAARKIGLDKDPQYETLLQWQYLRTLSSIYRRHLERKYSSPDQQAIDEYYHQNPSKFTEMKLQRIMIPRKNPSGPHNYEKLALEAAQRAREGAAKGEDMAQVQKEAYAALSLNSFLPATDMGVRRKMHLLPEEADEVFALKTGQVSKVEHENYNYVIYRVESMRLLPKESVQNEISVVLSKQGIERALDAVTSSAHPKFNERYFGSVPKSTIQSTPSASTKPPATPKHIPD